MSSAVRDVTIRVAVDRTERTTPGGGKGGGGGVKPPPLPPKLPVADMRALQTAADQAAKATERMSAAMLAAGEGALRVARGAAFAAASLADEKGLQNMLRLISGAQAVYDVFSGTYRMLNDGRKMLVAWRQATEAQATVQALNAVLTQQVSSGMATTATSTSTAAGASLVLAGGLTVSATAVTVMTGGIALLLAAITAVTVGVGAWRRGIKDAAEAAKQYARELADFYGSIIDRNTEVRRRWLDTFEDGREKLNQLEMQQKEVAQYLTRASHDLIDARARGDDAEAVAAAESKMKYMELQLEFQAAMVNQQRSLVSESKRELETARQKLDVENQRIQSIQAQLGLMSTADKLELGRLTAKAKAGGTLNRFELMELQRVGGSAVEDYVKKEAARLAIQTNPQLAQDFIEQFGGGDKRPQLQQDVANALKTFNDESDKLNKVLLKEYRDMVVRFKKVQKELNDVKVQAGLVTLPTPP